MKSVRLRRAALLALLALGSAQAIGLKFRPQGDTLTQAVQAAIAMLSTKDVPMTLDTSSGPTLTLGGVGVSAAPFNPDELARVVLVGAERRIELNPQGPVPLADAVRQVLQAELKMKEWTAAAAQQRFGGADLNGDGVIDLGDLAILMANYGLASPAAGDLNQDRKVDDADLRLFSALYSTALSQPPKPAAPPPAPAVPVPATTTPATSTPAPATPPATTPTTPTDSTTPAVPANPSVPATPSDPATPAPSPTTPTPPPSKP